MHGIFLKVLILKKCTCAGVLSVHHVLVWYRLRAEEGSRGPETVFTDSCKLLDECWDLSLVSL